MTVTVTEFTRNTRGGKFKDIFYDFTATSGEGAVVYTTPFKLIKGIVAYGQLGDDGLSGQLSVVEAQEVSGVGKVSITWTSAPPPEAGSFIVTGR
ncbi:MAG: hypothetical protein ACXABY_12645 [Candidatus Thorarchaeota archaeon]|jgi:hypothetical protein